MARSDEQYRQARERTRESILQAAIAAFSERRVTTKLLDVTGSPNRGVRGATACS